jgi:hypothetical protein
MASPVLVGRGRATVAENCYQNFWALLSVTRLAPYEKSLELGKLQTVDFSVEEVSNPKIQTIGSGKVSDGLPETVTD